MIDLAAWPTDKRVQFTLPVTPVSRQATADARRSFALAVRKEVMAAPYLLSGDVQLRVEWYIYEQTRYESDRAPDLDNILKPLIDAMVGPSGLLIDDNQIQKVTCLWQSTTYRSEALDVLLLFTKGQWVPKDGLVFVRFHDGLCLPIPHEHPREKMQKRFRAYASRLSARAIADQQGLPYHGAKILMPEQRVFHRTRLKGFRVLSADEFYQTLQS